MQNLRRIGIGLAALAVVAAVVGYAAWQKMGGAVGIAESQLPSFPDWPEPVADLSGGGTGEIHFATHSPYDFDILLLDVELKGLNLTKILGLIKKNNKAKLILIIDSDYNENLSCHD